MDPMDDGYDDYLDGDPRPPDQCTPPNTPPAQVEGGAHVAAATGTAFEVNAVWRIPRHPTYKNKQKYYRRNHVWQTIARLVRGGLTSEVAIERIYGVYGYNTSSTSQIMTAMVKDKRREPGGLHPNLRG